MSKIATINIETCVQSLLHLVNTSTENTSLIKELQISPQYDVKPMHLSFDTYLGKLLHLDAKKQEIYVHTEGNMDSSKHKHHSLLSIYSQQERYVAYDSQRYHGFVQISFLEPLNLSSGLISKRSMITLDCFSFMNESPYVLRTDCVSQLLFNKKKDFSYVVPTEWFFSKDVNHIHELHEAEFMSFLTAKAD